MANHKSAIKRIRQNEKKRTHNKYFARTTRKAINSLDTATEIKAEELPKVISMVDKLVKKNLIHKNKAGHIKSRLTKKANAPQA